MTLTYDSNLASVSQHPVPEWFNNAKFGIMVSWGLSAIPGFAVPCGSLPDVIRKKGYRYLYRNNPYAEFYWNSLKIEGSPTWQYHREVYGDTFNYPDFLEQFNRHVAEWEPDLWADDIKAWGAKYIVFVAKHHDGYLLWNSQTPNPYRPDFMSPRDVVGELGQAVRDRGVRLGLYYSGGPDWWFETRTVKDEVDFAISIPQSDAYIDYVNRHWRELIERYEPSILWNDIGFPAKLDINALYADYYNRVPDGVVNDRSLQADVRDLARHLPGRLLIRLGTRMAMKALSSGKPLASAHADFRTPEYTTVTKLTTTKWEATRGLGYSFGYNRNETAKHMLTVAELIQMLVDIVSKNGNLLLCVGPQGDGAIPELQRERLQGLGEWLSTHGEAIYDTHPWVVAEGETREGQALRFTARENALYIFLLGKITQTRVTIPDLRISPETHCEWLGDSIHVSLKNGGPEPVLELSSLPESESVHVIKLSPKPEYLS